MLLWVWIGLAVFVAALAGGLAFGAVRGLAAFRTVRTAGSELAESFERVSLATGEIATRLEALADGTARLDEALARLRASRARLNVQLEALNQVRAGIARITGVVPRKT